MEWWKAAEVGIDFGLPALLLLVGLWFVFGVGLRKWRRKAARRCLKCGYDMRGSESLVCVECGYEAKSQRVVEHGRVRWGWLVLGVILCFPGVWVAGLFLWHVPSAFKRMRIQGQYVRTSYFQKTASGIAFEIESYDRSDTPRREGWRINLIKELMKNKEAGCESFPPREEFGPVRLDEIRTMMAPGNTTLMISLYGAHAALFPIEHYESYLCLPRVYSLKVASTNKDDQRLSDEALEAIQSLKECREIEIVDFEVDSRVMKALGAMPSLEKVHIRKVTARAEDIAQLARSGSVSQLEIWFDRKIDAGDIEAMGKIEQLKNLSILVEGVNGDLDFAMAKLINSHRMVSLVLGGVMRGPQGGVNQTADAIARCGTLTDFAMDLTNWTAGQVKALGGLKELTALEINTNADEAHDQKMDLGWLDGLSKLDLLVLIGFEKAKLNIKSEGNRKWRDLYIQRTGVDEAFLKSLAGMNVPNIYLRDTGLGQKALDEVQMPASLESLNIRPWVPSEDACRRMAKERIERIEVDDMPLAGLEEIAKQTVNRKEKQVCLKASKLTKEEIAELRKRYPDFRVDVEEAKP